METMERKRPRPRRAFTDEFKADIVERCLKGDRSIAAVAHDFDLTVEPRSTVGSSRQRSTPAARSDGPHH